VRTESEIKPIPPAVGNGTGQQFSPGVEVYTEHFGLREKPFHVTPDPRFFYPTPVYQEAYASLLYGISQRKGFIVLTGEVGTGKTTLLRRLIKNLGDSVHFAFVYNTTLTFDEVLDAICSDLELPTGGGRRLEKIQALNVFLLQQLEQGGTAVVLIDEAHNLSVEALENLRLLSNLETGSEKLLQIVLVGQNELELKLTQPELRQLRDRVAIWCRLDRLKEREVGPFILHRLHTVGYDNQALFTPDAIQRIAVYSQGSPRQINIICDNALLLAYATYEKQVSAQIIEEIAQDLRLRNGAAQTANETIGVAPLLSNSLVETTPAREGESISTTSSPSEAAFTATAVNNRDHELGAEFFPRQSKRLTSTRVAIVLAFLLGVAGMGVLQSSGGHSLKLDFIANRLETSLSEWLAFVRQHLNAWSATETGPLEEQNEATSQTTVGTAAVFKPVAQNAPQFSKDQNDENREAKELAATLPPASPPAQAVVKRESIAVAGIPSQGIPSEPALSRDREGQRITVPHGATVLDLVSQKYGERDLLALDLVKEFNPHVNDLDKISDEEQLWLPALTRGTLLRQQPDASYHLILASFRKPEAAERLVRTVQRKGYSAIVTAQQVSESILLHRVEITNLQEAATIEQAWKLVNTQHSVSVAHPVAGEALTTKMIGP
jgi:general secretion pathway protein A